MRSSEHSFQLSDLFPPTAHTSRPAQEVTTNTLALIGNLPFSSLLHLALNHLDHEGEDGDRTEYRSVRQSRKAKGKAKAMDGGEGEDVERTWSSDSDDADMSNLARDTIRTRRARHVLVLTPDLAGLRTKLASENDFSLFGRPRSADRTALLQKITFKEIPTSAQLGYFLASCYDHTNPKAPELFSTYTSNQTGLEYDPSYLPVEPTMVILHSPSSYLDSNIHEGCGIEAYAGMLAHFVTTFTVSSRSAPLVVLIDPAASTQSLPTIPLHLPKPRKRFKRTNNDDDDDDTTNGSRAADKDAVVERLPLSVAIDRFFDCVGKVEPVPLSPTHLDFGHLEKWRIDVRTKRQPSYNFLEFSTERIGEDDEEGEEEGGLRITVEG